MVVLRVILAFVLFALSAAHPMNTEEALLQREEFYRSITAPDNCSYPINCPGKVLPRADKQTWQMNKSTIIMPCNNTGALRSLALTVKF